MEKLPDLVKAALSSACNSGKILSWKVQESDKGTLIQLVWKPRLERQDRDSALGFNWNSRNSMQLSNQYESESNRILKGSQEKTLRIESPPSGKHPWRTATLESRSFAITRPPHVSLLFDLILPAALFKQLTLVYAGIIASCVSGLPHAIYRPSPAKRKCF